MLQVELLNKKSIIISPLFKMPEALFGGWTRKLIRENVIWSFHTGITNNEEGSKWKMLAYPCGIMRVLFSSTKNDFVKFCKLSTVVYFQVKSKKLNKNVQGWVVSNNSHVDTDFF